ncbi:MAG: GNAT family N-acetyltransferase, partial [Oscillospiraceae bacterium]|nr:GNAT family N-acetyltransferase [Oscillospiraceae bacterium]
ENNLGRELSFSKDQLLLCAHMDSAAVLPGYRGHKLQARLCAMAEQELKKLGYRYLLCTVHPDNRFSLQNMQKSGYEIQKTMFKYGGLPRHILLKTLP